METSVDLPEPLFRRAKVTAATRGVSLKSFIMQAVEQSLDLPASSRSARLAALSTLPPEMLAEIQTRIDGADAANLALSPACQTCGFPGPPFRFCSGSSLT